MKKLTIVLVLTITGLFVTAQTLERPYDINVPTNYTCDAQLRASLSRCVAIRDFCIYNISWANMGLAVLNSTRTVTRFNSSAIEMTITYSTGGDELISGGSFTDVCFTSGDTGCYSFKTIPQEVINEWKSSNSPGIYYHDFIKRQYNLNPCNR